MPEKKKSVVPCLRFPEFRDAGEWEVKQLGKLFQERNERDGSGLELLSVTRSDGVVKTSELDRINNANADLSNYKKVYPNDIVYNSMRMWQGASGVSKYFGVVSPAYTVITLIENQDSAYWAYYFRCKESIEKFSRFSQGVTSDTWNLKYPAFSIITFPVPKLIEEQQKIADCLSSLDEVIDLEAQKLEALKAHKKGLMQQLFPREGETAPHLRFPEFHDAEEWEVKRLGEVCSTFTGGTPSSSRKEYYGGSIPFIRSAEIDQDRTELFLTEEGLKNSSAKLVIKGDILIALYGANSGNGALSKIDGAINQAILCLRSKFNHTFILDYWRLRKNEIVMQYLQGGQGNLSAEIVKSIAFAFPSLPEQQKIADCLSSLDEVINLQTQKLDALKAHKKGLMQQLFPQEVG